MLQELRICNFAIIEEQTVSLASGLNVFSGETGSGKSIILEALQLVLGGRGNTDFIRSGTKGLEVQAIFDLSDLPSAVASELPDIVFDDREEGDPERELVVSRHLGSSGRNRIFINGHLATVSLLQETCARLISICSQNQFIRLFDPAYHVELIDSYGGYSKLITDYGQAFSDWRTLSERLEVLEAKVSENILRRAELEHIVSELTRLNPEPGLRDALERQIQVEGNCERLIDGSARIADALNIEGGVLSQIGEISSQLDALEAIDPSFKDINGIFNSARTNLIECEAELSGYASRLEVDEEELSNRREKLAALATLERKYRTDSAGLLSLLVEAQNELMLIDEGQNLDALREKEAKLRARAEKLAGEIRAQRKKTAAKLSKAVASELAELNMKDARLKVSMEERELTRSGGDRVEFVIATNKGEPFRALRQIASGGELSRIMLVLKKILRDSSGVQVLVFDEVDSGVSGGVARAVGEKLRALADDGQVICITHLPQVASLADRHLLVEKTVGKRASTLVKALSEDQRVEEVARMLAGYKVTAAARESARELMASNS